MKLYLFKRAADSKWIFGQNIDCLHDSGICRPVPSTDRSKITIIYNEKNEANPNIYDHPVTDFLKEDGLAYANFAELSGVYVDFFMASIMATGGSSGGSGGNIRVELSAGDGVLTAFALPLNCDITQPKSAFAVSADGVTPLYDAEFTLSTVLGVPTVTFAVAPLNGNVPVVWYPPLANSVYPSGKPVKLSLSFNRPADVLDYAANDAVGPVTVGAAALELSGDAAFSNGGGGTISLIKYEVPAKFAGKTLTCYLYNELPSSLVGDNVPFVLDTANRLKRVAKIDVTIDAVENASTIAWGQSELFLQYQTLATSKKLYAAFKVGEAVVAPESEGLFTVAITTNIQA